MTEPKTDAGRRVVALPQLVIDAVTEHLTLHDDPDAPLFPAEDGGLLPATTFYKHPLRRATSCPSRTLNGRGPKRLPF